ncbi:hypothetical protein FRB91_009931 [Serendipita sp. 411]|nr:hypothetical protein FRC15_005272 [Serendipita sp. 397]KAG8774643.1 hypothetical protein FRC16_005038 [Serendipita sp. 398]KAG8837446.1 hypothetical protein FRC18_009285 [Serendipita sp. 400]KAG8858346.1 hypothetical protein FRB91_009931 [Serendipita sp. 411]
MPNITLASAVVPSLLTPILISLGLWIYLRVKRIETRLQHMHAIAAIMRLQREEEDTEGLVQERPRFYDLFLTREPRNVPFSSPEENTVPLAAQASVDSEKRLANKEIDVVFLIRMPHQTNRSQLSVEDPLELATITFVERMGDRTHDGRKDTSKPSRRR